MRKRLLTSCCVGQPPLDVRPGRLLADTTVLVSPSNVVLSEETKDGMALNFRALYVRLIISMKTIETQNNISHIRYIHICTRSFTLSLHVHYIPCRRLLVRAAAVDLSNTPATVRRFLWAPPTLEVPVLWSSGLAFIDDLEPEREPAAPLAPTAPSTETCVTLTRRRGEWRVLSVLWRFLLSALCTTILRARNHSAAFLWINNWSASTCRRVSCNSCIAESCFNEADFPRSAVL
eukprot:284815977_4